jgi:aryl-alcohol dehydrogenase-like predicted oxidoreductase
MRSTAIPDTDLRPSCIALGIADLGVKNTEREAHALLDAFVEQGGTCIDTARVYSNWVPGESSRSERILGDWLQSSGMRDRLVVATKGAHPQLDSMHVPRMSPGEVQGDLEGSLRSMRIDAIDLYYLHRDDSSTPVEPIIDMLDSFVAGGKIRYYACSNWKPHRIEQACAYARAKGTRGFVANQMLWNAGSWTMRPPPDPTIVLFNRATRELHRRLPLAAFPYSSQANGFFSKLHERGGEPDEQLLESGYYSNANCAVYRIMSDIARKRGLAITEIVLLYLLEQDIVTIPIVGCRNREQLGSSLTAASRRLDEDDLSRITAAAQAA